jgi:hypothetical protein
MRDSLKDMPLSTALLVVVTLFVLAGSVHHVAYTFSTLEGGNLIWGYVQALGIDLGILGLAYGIQLRKRQGRPTLPLWSVLILVTFISAYANYLYGIMHQQPLQTASAFDQMVVFLRPFLLSVTLPIIMFALIEIIGEDRNYALKVQAQSEPAEPPPQPEASEPAPREPERLCTRWCSRWSATATGTPKKPRWSNCCGCCTSSRTCSRTKLAERLGCSRQTLYNYLQELESRGYIRRTPTATRPS